MGASLKEGHSGLLTILERQIYDQLQEIKHLKTQNQSLNANLWTI